MDTRRLVLPKTGFRIPKDREHWRLYFLAGPIRGGGDWQSNAINLLLNLDTESYIVCPCRYPADHPMAEYAVKSDVELTTSQLFFESQTLWERHYMKLAAQEQKQGTLIFWLGAEDEHNPRPKEDGPYARDTYGELGRWSIRSAESSARVVIGADRQFNGLSVIQKNLDADHGRPFHIHKTLDETLRAAVELARK